MGALRSAPTGSSNTTPSTFKKLPGALGATPNGCTEKCSHWKFKQKLTTTTQDSKYLQEATRSLGGYIQWVKNLHKYLRAFWSSPSQHQRLARVNEVQSLRLSPKTP